MKIFNGIYKLTFGVVEKHTPMTVRTIEHRTKELNKFSQKDLHFKKADIEFKENNEGCVIRLPLEAGENIYGFGLQLKAFNHKGKKVTIRNNADPKSDSGDSHAPIPFYVSSKGYGVFVDSARYLSFYCGGNKQKGQSSENHLLRREKLVYTTEDLYRPAPFEEGRKMIIEVPVAKGADIYIIEGKNLMEIVKKYNLLSGGGCKVPQWGLGVWYRAYSSANCEQLIGIAQNFKENDIPLDVLGIEPGWHSYSYSCSYKWDEVRMEGYENMLKTFKRMDVKVNLWEHAFIHPTALFYKEIMPFCGDYEVWEGLVPDFANKEAIKIFADYHKENLVKKGISGFKLDECDGSDYTGGWSFPNSTEFPSGLNGDQMHNLYGVLYQEAMLKPYKELNKETYGLVRSSHLFASNLPYVLYSDLYDHKDFIRGIVNSGFSGMLWTPELRDGKNEKDLIRRLQTVVFSAQCLINGWYIKHTPWFNMNVEENIKDIEMESSKEITKLVKKWLKLRKELVPYIMKAFEKYQSEGIPPFRALILDYPDDKNTYNIDDQYMMGDEMMIAPLTAESDKRSVYIPKGEWKCYFTNKKYTMGWYEVEYQLDQMPVFIQI